MLGLFTCPWMAKRSDKYDVLLGGCLSVNATGSCRKKKNDERKFSPKITLGFENRRSIYPVFHLRRGILQKSVQLAFLDIWRQLFVRLSL